MGGCFRMDHGALWAKGRRRRIGDGRTHGIQAAYGIVSSLLSKTDFTNRIGRRCFKADGSEPSGILPNGS